MWGAIIKRMRVGTARRFSSIASDSLFAGLRPILAPDCVSWARELATQMTTIVDSAAATADLLQDFARLKGVGATGGGESR